MYKIKISDKKLKYMLEKAEVDLKESEKTVYFLKNKSNELLEFEIYKELNFMEFETNDKCEINDVIVKKKKIKRE